MTLPLTTAQGFFSQTPKPNFQPNFQANFQAKTPGTWRRFLPKVLQLLGESERDDNAFLGNVWLVISRCCFEVVIAASVEHKALRI